MSPIGQFNNYFQEKTAFSQEETALQPRHIGAALLHYRYGEIQ